MNNLFSALTFSVLLGLSSSSFAADQVQWSKSLLKQPAEWYLSDAARAVADSVIHYQSQQGGWPKNTDLAQPISSRYNLHKPDKKLENSFDNDATTLPMQFLARVAQATGEKSYSESFLRGLDYLLAAQYPNGGWPQFWPLRKGYPSHITFNDDAMIQVMMVLRDVANRKALYQFVDARRREKAEKAVSRGIETILNTQIIQDGQRTAWCAQHDARTLEPAWARAFEPPSLSGGETVGIVRFLMSIEQPTEEIIAAVTGAVEWLRAVQITGVRLEQVLNDDGRIERNLVADPGSPPLWARFYELKTNRPLYVDRDSVFRYDYSKISYERRSGYAYHGTWASSLLERDYPKWRNKHRLL